MKINGDLNNISNRSNIYTYLQKPQAKGENPFANNSSIFEFKGSEYNDLYTHTENKAAELRESLKEVKEEQGFIGKAWDGIKGIFGGGSKKIEKQIEKYEKGEISYEEVQKSVEGYKEGQKMSVDVVADLASGIVSVMAFALAVPTGGASLVAGAALAATVGAGVKIGVKALDAKAGGREYSSKDFWYDTATGAINGLLAPITNGIGACVTKSIGQKLGLTVLKEGTEEIIEQGAKASLKSLITSQGVKVSGGSLAGRAVATGAGMAVDGSLGGAADNAVRAAMNGENIIDAAVQGAVGGLIMAPVIGGGFKVAGKVGHAINNKLTVNSVLPDSANISFGQGLIGDCALLSTIDGMLHNPQTLQKIQKSITQSIDGSYNVTIGGRTVKVMREALTDEMLSDKTGIRIFEQAYKQLAGELDGGFADVVAKQFGLNPVHINPASITDDTLDLLAREKGNGVFSFGTKVDANGNIALEGTNHYFSIREIDPATKKVIVTDPYNTAKTIELSYDDVKKLAVSIDGGTIKTSETLPHYVRKPGDLPFYGYEIDGRFVYVDRPENINELLVDLIDDEHSFYLDSHNVLHTAANDKATDLARSLDIQSALIQLRLAEDVLAEYTPKLEQLQSCMSAIREQPGGKYFANINKIQTLFEKFYNPETKTLNVTLSELLELDGFSFLKRTDFNEKSLAQILDVINSQDDFMSILNSGIEADGIIKNATRSRMDAERFINDSYKKWWNDEHSVSVLERDGDDWVIKTKTLKYKSEDIEYSHVIRITNEEFLEYERLLSIPKYKKLLGSMDNLHAMHRLIERYGLPNGAKTGSKVNFQNITNLLDTISDILENPAKYDLLSKNDNVIHFPALGFQIKRGFTSRNGCALILSNPGSQKYDAIILNKSGQIQTVIANTSQNEIDNAFCQILEKSQKLTNLNDIANISDDDICNFIISSIESENYDVF